jgi:hypothetical protein
MGRTVTPKYVVELGGFLRLNPFQSAWKGRVPSIAQLERHVMAYVVSTYAGYCNERTGQAYGVTIPSYAVVRENKPQGRALVEWRAPMFQVLPNAADYPDVAKARLQAATAEWLDANFPNREVRA